MAATNPQPDSAESGHTRNGRYALVTPLLPTRPLHLTLREGLGLSRVRAAGDKRWKVGELARATGLTVRTLHHYDQLGLLVASERTEGSHRLYAERDVSRLYRVLALRHVGLSLAEIAALLDGEELDLTGTVRRHLARVERELEQGEQLRRYLVHILDALERSLEPSVDHFIAAMEVMTMIETTVEDVVMRVPEEDADAGVFRFKDRSRIVLLRETHGERILPIWTGFPEADGLALQLAGRATRRPLTYEFMGRLLEAAGARVDRVVIESFQENTYFATVTVTAGGESREVDARPSDALNLAARQGVSVLVDSKVMDEHGVASLQDAGALEDTAGQLGGSGEWKSLLDRMRHEESFTVKGPPREQPLNFERFTERARHVVLLAHEEARALKHDHIGTEHILLGLLGEAEGVAARVLGSLRVTVDPVRAQVVALVGPGEEVTSGQIPFTPRAEKVLELALREALSLGHNYIGTEHILLALVRENEGVAADILLEFDADPEKVRNEAIRVL